MLRILGLIGLWKRRVRGDLIVVLNILTKGSGGADIDLFTLRSGTGPEGMA